MDIRRKNKKMISKKHLLIIGVPLVVCATYAGVALGQSWWPFTDHTEPDVNTPTQSSNSASKPSVADAEDKKTYVDSNLDNGASTQQAAPDVSISIEPYRYNDETVVVSTKLGATPDGTCTLTITNGQKKDVQTADIIYQPMDSSCAGFSIPVSRLGKGAWNILLVVLSRGHERSVNQTIEVN